MVCRGGEFAGERERARAPMAMGSERSKPLHNFTLPRLRWGGQRYMRCMKVAAAADSSSAAAADDDRRSPAARSHPPFRRREPDFERRRCFARESDRGRRGGGIVGAADDEDDEGGGGDCGIEAVRQKLMFDLRAETDKMKDELLREEVESVAAAAAAAAEEAEAESGAAAAVAAEESRPWNLRTRRAACKAPIVGAGAGGGRVNSSPSRTEDAAGAGGNDPKSSPRVLRGNGGGSATQKTEERAKFAVALKRKEIEEDFMAMVGHRPPRRFKKRPKNVQKQLDLLFPGLWLTEISVDTYKVDENPENGKR
ncbi:uncharacterized protein LOC115664203 [Syzygium oleosum]|uniref:uncharacterized protein LOC115664203 n=1 Tax=Syzygium oleosum TaxID=219896 RepID=UPI0024BAF51C|nr:uncharacterized protein LOC115664203 [Syzygium oleosum]